MEPLIPRNLYLAGPKPSQAWDREDVTSAIIATGHHLEWLMLLPDDIRPPRQVFRKGAEWLLATVRRQSGEPVVVGSSWNYFPLLYHAPDRTGYFLYTDGRPLLHYNGSAAVTPQDLITGEQLRALRSRRVWVVDVVISSGEGSAGPVPPDWMEKSRQTFPGVFALGPVTVIEYQTAVGRPPESAPNKP